MTKPPNKSAPLFRAEHLKENVRESIAMADEQIKYGEDYADSFRSSRRELINLYAKLGGDPLEVSRKGAVYTPGKDPQIWEYAVEALGKIGRPATFDELAEELERQGVELGKGRISLTNSIQPWAIEERSNSRGGKPLRFRMAKAYSSGKELTKALKSGEKIGLVEWDKKMWKE